MRLLAVPGRHILWHPFLEDRFLVTGGTQITLYTWEGGNEDYKHIASRSLHDPQLVKVCASSFLRIAAESLRSVWRGLHIQHSPILLQQEPLPER